MKTLKNMATELDTCIATTKRQAIEASAFVRIGRKIYVDEVEFYKYYKQKTMENIKNKTMNESQKRKEA